MSTWAIVVAAGTGTRFGDRKQYQPLRGARVLDWALREAVGRCDGVVLVVPPDQVGTEEPSATTIVAGGETRSMSVRNGLAAVPEGADVIVVHDAARPVPMPEVWDRVLAAVAAGADAAVPAVPVTDTLREVGGKAVDRGRFVAVQTPQAFRADALRAAHSRWPRRHRRRQPGRGQRWQGGARGRRSRQREDHDAHRPRRGGAPVPVRVGQGFDVHPFSDDPDRPLVLGGVPFPGERGLAGHSDADVVAHAVTDALLGAAGLGDIGQHFPDTDPAFAGADSIELLRRAVADVRASGWEPGNVDCTVVLEAPRLAPKRAEIEARLADAVGAPVTVKGKRAEGLGALGRAEGIACFAVALVHREP